MKMLKLVLSYSLPACCACAAATPAGMSLPYARVPPANPGVAVPRHFSVWRKGQPFAHLGDGVLRCGGSRLRFSGHDHFPWRKVSSIGESGSTNNACRRIVSPRLVRQFQQRNQIRIIHSKDRPVVGHGTIYHHVRQPLVGGDHFRILFHAFHGSALSVCFSRISSSELRASESSGSMRPFAVTGNCPIQLRRSPGPLAFVVCRKTTAPSRTSTTAETIFGKTFSCANRRPCCPSCATPAG